MGGGKGPKASGSEKAMAAMAQGLFDQTQGSRDYWTSMFGQAEQGGFDPTTAPAYAPARGAMEAQYGVARDNLLGSMPTGGGLNDALVGLESNRAGAVGGLSADIIQQLLEKSFGTSFGAPGQAMGGMSSATAAAAQRQAAASQAQGAKGQGVGQMIGMLGGAAIGGPGGAAIGSGVGGKAGGAAAPTVMRT